MTQPKPNIEDFNIHSKFKEWRPQQLEAIHELQTSEDSTILLNMPTGSGKSLAIYGFAHDRFTHHAERTLVGTATKALQDQNLSDFSTSSTYSDVRGANAYKCSSFIHPYIMCDYGIEAGCPARSTRECPQSQAIDHSLTTPIVCANYSMFAHQQISKYHRNNLGLGSFDNIICDEAQNIFSMLCSTLTCKVTNEDITQFRKHSLFNDHITLDSEESWVSWINHSSHIHEHFIQTVKEELQQRSPSSTLLDRRKLANKLERIRFSIQDFHSHSNPGEWVAHTETYTRGKKKTTTHYLEPVILPQSYIDLILRDNRKAKKLILISGTIVPKTARLLGLKESLTYLKFPDTFDPAQSPIYCVKNTTITHRTPEFMWSSLIRKIVTLIKNRRDRKGIIHSVSYKRAAQIQREIQTHLGNSVEIYTHRDSSTLTPQLDRYRATNKAAVFISPSITTGINLPHAECRYIIIPKSPFPDSRHPVMKARIAYDKEIVPYTMLQDLQQMSRRGTRSNDDWCETFIFDDLAHITIKKFPHLLSPWFTRKGGCFKGWTDYNKVIKPNLP